MLSPTKVYRIYYVVVMAGFPDRVRLDDLTLLANKCFYTNLLVCTSPARCRDDVSRVSVWNSNRLIVHSIGNLQRFSDNVDVIDQLDLFESRHYIGNCPFLNVLVLLKLATLISQKIDLFYTRAKKSNLIHLKASHYQLNNVQLISDDLNFVGDSELSKRGYFLDNRLGVEKLV